MDRVEKTHLQQVLGDRRQAIAASWYQAIADTGFVPFTAAEVHQRLLDLTEQAIALLLSETFDEAQVQALGASLAELHYLEAGALGRTQQVLGEQLLAGLPAQQVAGLQPRLTLLLSALAVGFLHGVCRTVLAEQEEIRRAFADELGRTGEALREAYGQVEERVRDRTAELALANEQLRSEISARLRSVESLQESEETVRALLNATTDIVALLDRKGFVLEINETAARRFNRSIDQMIGHHPWDLLPPEVSQRRKAYVDEVIRTAKPIRFEDERAGTWFDNVFYPILDAQGTVTRVAVWVRDITRRMQREQELERRVAERTEAVSTANVRLEAEVAERQRTEIELRLSRKETQRSHRLLLALSQAAQAVQRATTPEEVYQTLGDQIARLGFVALLLGVGKDRDHLTLVHDTLDSGALRTVEKLTGLSTKSLRVPVAPGGMLAPVIDEGQSIYLEQTAEIMERGFPKLGRGLIERVLTMLGVESAVCAPLQLDGQTSGILAVIGSELSETDLPAVAAFANQAAIALENARLFQEVGASRRRLQRLAREVVSAQEAERHRLSRTLHDDAGQALTALKISLELMGDDLPADSQSLRERLADAATLTDTTMGRLRTLAQDLRPPALDAVGLNHTLEGLCRDFAGRTRLLIDYRGLDVTGLPEPVSTCLYRFLQEALTNVAKHAGARRVRVVLDHDAEAISLSVQDDGQGFPEEVAISDLEQSFGIGLLGMRERLESLDGWLKVESQTGQGTCLAAYIPLEEA